MNMKESRSCYTCQRQSFNLMSATCGHKICFHCVKSNKNSHKCSVCMPHPRPKTYHSPSRTLSQDPKERSTKVKDSDSKLNSQCSPIIVPRSRLSPHKQSTAMAEIQQIVMEPLPQQILNCKQHSEPLSMYCKSAKELICSVCLCSKFKQNGDILPIRSAEEPLRKQNKLNRQESKIILGNIENAQNVISKNISIFRNCYNSSLQAIETLCSQIHKQVQATQKKAREQLLTFFDGKFKQCEQIEQDLSYLNSILRDFKQSNKDSCTFNELLYLFTSFKVIKGTVKNLNLDYLPYSKEIQIIETNKYQFKETLRDVIKFKFDLPLKLGSRKKPKSQSNKSVSRSKHEDFDEVQRQGYTDKLKQRSSLTKRHQMSLCNNIHGIEIGEQERNLYKLLLKTKFKL